MKIYKFRAWDKKNKNWMITDNILIDSSGELWDLREKPIARFSKEIKNLIDIQYY